MNKYRSALPQLGDQMFVTEAGLETELVFKRGIALPEFAAFDLLKDDAGCATLRDYYARFVTLANAHGMGAVLETPTWRASSDWGARLGHDARALAEVNRRAVELLASVRAELERPGSPVVVSGNLGPRGDGYRPEARMDAYDAEAYHRQQIRTFAGTEADMVSGLTLNYVAEAVGIARAARNFEMPVAISFTVETDGCLPTGESLAEAVEATDAATDGYPSYYMINCAHPSHFEHVLAGGGAWRERIRGVRANASRLSHVELDGCTELDEGHPQELGAQYRALARWLPRLSVVGGCCGTDLRHVSAICTAMAA